MEEVSIRDALQKVVDRPAPEADYAAIDAPVHELIARTLFDIANRPDSRVRGSMSRATKAQRMILNRHTGLRRAGTHPAAREAEGLEFLDLTKGVLQ